MSHPFSERLLIPGGSFRSLREIVGVDFVYRIEFHAVRDAGSFFSKHTVRIGKRHPLNHSRSRRLIERLDTTVEGAGWIARY